MKTIRICTLVIIIALAYAFYMAVMDGRADSNGFAAWHAQGASMVGGDCFANRADGDFYPNGQNSSHCEDGDSVPVVPTVKQDKHNNTAPTAPTAPTVTSETETPVIVDNGGETIPTDTTDNTPPVVKDDKQKCNKGEGNGGEGCDPGNNPDKGNNDEDTGKDKSNKS